MQNTKKRVYVCLYTYMCVCVWHSIAQYRAGLCSTLACGVLGIFCYYYTHFIFKVESYLDLGGLIPVVHLHLLLEELRRISIDLVLAIF